MKPLSQQCEPSGDHRRWDGRERVEEVPNTRTRKAVDDVGASFLAARAVFFNSSAALVLRQPDRHRPHVPRQNCFMTQVDRIQNGLADKVITE